MNKITNILVPIDFTEYSLNAVAIAAQIAKQNSSIITLIHIIDLSVNQYVGIDVDGGLTMNDLIEKYLHLLNKIREDISKNYKVNTNILLERGNVISIILDKAKELNADLILIGTHGTEPKNFFLGKNAFHIIKQAHCSVLTIPKERTNGTITKIVFPGKTIQTMNEKCTFIESIVQEDDIVMEISGFSGETSFNISVLNETIGYLEAKFIKGQVKSIGELKNFVDVINDSLHDLSIELITISIERDSKRIPVLSVVHI